MTRNIQRSFFPSKDDSNKLKKLTEELTNVMLREDTDKEFGEIWNSIKKEEERLKKGFLEKYPPNPPNDKCKFATISGLLFENSSKPEKGDFRHCLTWGSEEIYIWTHKRDEYSGLVSKASPNVIDEKPYWKTFGSAMKSAVGLTSSFESIWDFEYKWIYNFDPAKLLENQEWLDEDDHIFSYNFGSVKSIRFFYEISSILELLFRDDSFFIATQNLVVAVENHWFCQVCALRKPENRTHHNHEPTTWEVADQIPKMEVAIVQATRSVDAILGKPGNREKDGKLHKMKERWVNQLDISYDQIFKLTDQTYLDYYYGLFELRGIAAHSLGNMPYELKRELTIQAQSFAWLILLSYYRKQQVNKEEAVDKLNVNYELIRKEPEDFSTKLTKKSQEMRQMNSTT